MTAITKLLLSGDATIEATYKLQDATNNLFNAMLVSKPAAYDRSLLKNLTDTFVINIFKYSKENPDVMQKETKKLICKLKKLGYKKISLSSIERAASRARMAASIK